MLFIFLDLTKSFYNDPCPILKQHHTLYAHCLLDKRMIKAQRICSNIQIRRNKSLYPLKLIANKLLRLALAIRERISTCLSISFLRGILFSLLFSRTVEFCSLSSTSRQQSGSIYILIYYWSHSNKIAFPTKTRLSPRSVAMVTYTIIYKENIS